MDMIALRRELHLIPEVGLQLPMTQNLLMDALAGLGLEMHRGRDLTSIVAVLRGGSRAVNGVRNVLLRSDMDALPVVEETGLEFASTNGSMHACGHDLHMAMLVAAAHRLADVRHELAGDVAFVFQPGEEGHGGARMMLSEGVLNVAGVKPVAAFGMHALSYHVPNRQIGMRPGPIMSGSTLVRVTFTGRGGHGSAPHLTNDPLLAGAVFVSTVTTAVSRAIDMFEPHTLTFGSFQAGNSYNVIPDRVVLLGTLRSFSADVADRARGVIRAVAEAVARANAVDVEVTLTEDTVPTSSDPREVDLARTVDQQSTIILDRPISVSEDFCWFLKEVPGVFVLLGAQLPTSDGSPPASNHSAKAIFDESAMVAGCELEVNWTIRRLQSI
jgi:hippurate hydrolase